MVRFLRILRSVNFLVIAAIGRNFEEIIVERIFFMSKTEAQRNIVITLDYETWHPAVPAGKRIDWNETVIAPTARLLEICNRNNAKLTIFFEIGEYYWLRGSRPDIAHAIEGQLRDIIRDGHDVQLHLHTSWLPETGARYDEATDTWFWDNRYQKLHEYPGDITELLLRCKNDLEAMLRPVNPEYHVTTFRAGAYQIQPSKQIADALLAAGISADSSVWQGGYQPERGNDFRMAWSGQPYFASSYNVNYCAPPAERNFLEIPISTIKRFPRIFGIPLPFLRKKVKRWLFDDADFPTMFSTFRMLDTLPRAEQFKLYFARTFPALQKFLVKVGYHGGRKFTPISHIIPWLTPKTHGDMLQNRVYVMIGHSKANINFADFEKLLLKLSGMSDIRFSTISEIVNLTQDTMQKESLQEDLDFQVKIEYKAIIGEERNEKISGYLQEKIPLDSQTVLDLGCGSGYWTKAIKERLITPKRVVGLDFGDDFLEKARSVYGAEAIKGDFHNLPFDNDYFDAIYADNTIEHSFSPHRVLEECFRTLRPGGLLAMCVPPDARNPDYITPNHNWRMDSDEIRARLEDIGFEHIQIEEIDAVKEWGERPYLPSDNISTYVTARKSYNEFERLREIALFCYQAILPEKDNRTISGYKILKDGYGWCGSYSRAAHYLLSQEGFNSRIVTFFLRNLPFGRGPEGLDTHTAVEVLSKDGKWLLLDATCGIVYPYSIDELLQNPKLADEYLDSAHFTPDARWHERRYEWYCSTKAYERAYGKKHPKEWWMKFKSHF